MKSKGLEFLISINCFTSLGSLITEQPQWEITWDFPEHLFSGEKDGLDFELIFIMFGMF